MLELTIFPSGFGEPTGSPFAMKAWCLLDHSGQNYTLEIAGDTRKAPKSKLPVLKDGDQLIPDSDQIRDHLEARFDIDFDQGLSAHERGVSRSIIRMVEEHMYFALLSTRWQNDKNWPFVNSEFFGGLPFPLKLFVPNLVRKNTIKSTIGQGMGRFSPDEQSKRVAKDFQALSNLLGEEKFIFGNNPTAADFSAVPMLRAMHGFPVKTNISELLEQHKNLMAYIERGKNALYPKP